MQTFANIDVAKPVQVCRNLNKPSCQFIARHGAMANEIETPKNENDQERRASQVTTAESH